MILNIWSYEWYILTIYFLIGVLIYNFNWNKCGNWRFNSLKTQLRELYVRVKNLWFTGENKYLQNSISIIIVNILLILIVMLKNCSGHKIVNSISQFCMSNLVWMYSMYLTYLFIIVFGLFKAIFRWKIDVTDLRNSIIFLFILFFYFISLNNIFIILFLIECQSTLTVYFLVTSQQTMKLFIKIKEYDIYKSMVEAYFARITLLFLQFWVIFIAAFLFLFTILWFSNAIGVISWIEIWYTSYFYIAKIGFYSVGVILIVGVVFLSSLFLKIGMFPFHFWKPDLYRSLSLWGIIWYITLFTFVLMFFIIVICNLFLENNMVIWRIIIYIVQVVGCLIMLNIIFIVTELKVYIAYMSAFHMSYIFFFFLVEQKINLVFAINYLIMYIIVMIFFFSLLISIKNKEVKFLTDFKIANQVYIWGCFMISVIIAMSGVPPFIGFWLKISLVINLLYINKILLVVIIFISGVYLMYFYMQNYRFIGGIQFTWNYISICLDQRYWFIYLVISICFFININYLFFFNDILNWVSCLNILSSFQW